MGKLARRCRFLADGIQLDETWRLLLSREFLFSACKAAVNSDDISELEEAYSLLSCPSAYENAISAHRREFNLTSGTSRLDRIRQSLACARFAASCRQPLKASAKQELAIWAPRALGLDSPMDSLELTLVETTETIIDRALAAATNYSVDLAFPRALVREYLGLEEQCLATMKIPILLFDQINETGKLGWLYLQKYGSGVGRFYLAPQASLSTEIADDTLEGTLAAWSYACIDDGPLNFDVQWWLEGTGSISGRSADVAFAVGLRLLIRNAPYDSSCVITATLNAESLGVVNGLCEPGNPKLTAAQTLRREKAVTVIVAEGTPLSAADRTQWRSKGIEIVACPTVDDALRVASRQLQLLDDFLANQIKHVLEQASRRFERAIAAPRDLEDLVVPVRVARGVRSSASEGDHLEAAQVSSSTDANSVSMSSSSPDDDTNSSREVLPWAKFVEQTASHAIVLGDPGFGKTTLLWQLVANQCHAARQQLRSLNCSLSELTFSMFIPAAALADLHSNAESTNAKAIIDCIASLYAMDPQIAAIVEQKILNGQCVICLDALDEVTNLRALTSYLSRFVRENTNTKLLLTSRLSGYAGPPFDISENSQAELLPFTNSQIRAAIDVWFQHDADVRDSITRQVRKSKHLHDVLRSPILLHLACRQVLQSIEKQKALPTWERRSELYEGFVLLALEQLEKRTHQPVTQMERFEFRVFLGELALNLWKKDPKRTIWSCNQIYQAVREVVVGKLYGLQNRFPHLLDDLQNSGLIVPVSAGEPLAPMMFLHRTVGEYLAGHQLARRISEDGCLETWALIEKKSWDPAWRELILFLAGNLASAKQLLDRLREPQATSGNPHGDDLLRYRLMLAAQCLPEINLTKNAEAAREIAESVIRVVSSSKSFTSLEEVVNALRALFLFNSMVDEGQRIPDLHHRIPMVEQVLPRIGAAAATQDLEVWLVDKLWHACDSYPNQAIQSRSAPQPIANALVSVFDKVDLEKVLRLESGDDSKKWRVCGALLRAASELNPSSVQLTTDFLCSLGSSLFRAAEVNSIGLRQTIKYLPKVDSTTLEESGLLEQCCSAIEAPKSEDAKRSAFGLLTSLGESAGKNTKIRTLFANLEFTASSRIVVDAVNSMRDSLATPEFIASLENAILRMPKPNSELGLDIYFAIRAYHEPSWITGAERLVRQYESGGKRVEELASSHPSQELVSLLDHFFDDRTLRSLGLRVAKSFIASLESGPKLHADHILNQQLLWLDSMVSRLLNLETPNTFDSPRVLDTIKMSSELNVRLLYPILVSLSCRYRSSDRLAVWITKTLRNASADYESQFWLVSKAAATLRREQRQTLKLEIEAEGLLNTVRTFPFLVKAIESDSSFLIDCILEKLQHQPSPSEERDLLNLLGELEARYLDNRVATVAVNLLKQRRRPLREIGWRILGQLEPSQVTQELVTIAFSTLGEESQVGISTEAIAVLVRHYPSQYVARIATIFSDKEHSAREHIVKIVPSLGNLICNSEILAQLEARLQSRFRHEQTEAVQVLVGALTNCDDEHRRAILHLLTVLDDKSIFSRLLLIQYPDPSLVCWLLRELGNPDPKVVAVTCHVLLMRSGGNTGAKLEPIVSRVPLDAKLRFRILANQLISSQQDTHLLQQIAVACANQGYRLFDRKGEYVEGLAFDELAS